MSSQWRTMPLAMAVLVLFSAIGCGPAVRIDPLIGDDPEVLRYVTTSVPDLSKNPPTMAVRALYDALVRGDMKAAWALLSKSIRAELDSSAVALGATSGRAVFMASGQDGVPVRGADGKVHRVTPLRWLLAEDIAYYRLTLDPEQKPKDTGSEAVVYVIDSDDNFRAVHLIREDGVWRVHHPTLHSDSGDSPRRTATP